MLLDGSGEPDRPKTRILRSSDGRPPDGWTAVADTLEEPCHQWKSRETPIADPLGVEWIGDGGPARPGWRYTAIVWMVYPSPFSTHRSRRELGC